MSYRSLNLVLGLLLAALVVAALVALSALGIVIYNQVLDTETIEHTEYYAPPTDPWQELTDDPLEDKNPAFDPTLVDRRPLGDWLVNSSSAVIKLDVVAAKPDQDAALLTLHPSYAAAVKVARKSFGDDVLPSV